MSPLAASRRGPAERGQPVGVGDVHALGALEEHEVAQRLLAERQQRQLHAGRVVAGGRGRFGRDRCGAAPIADSRFCTSARCSISWAATCEMCLRQRWTASSFVLGQALVLGLLQLRTPRTGTGT